MYAHITLLHTNYTEQKKKVFKFRSCLAVLKKSTVTQSLSKVRVTPFGKSRHGHRAKLTSV